MPIVNGKYQNPQWRNGGPPALDADELNAISDTLEKVDSGSGGGGGNYQQGNGILIDDDTISTRLSTQQGNVATFGPDGGLYVPPGGGGGSDGKKTAIVVGTSANGWTADDCDFLCDGTDDHAEINEAIQTADVGQVLLLPGTYNLGGQVSIAKNIALCGAGPLNADYSYMPANSRVTISDTRPWFGGGNSPSSASIFSSADNATLFNIRLAANRTTRVGIYATGSLEASYCSILSIYHCIYMDGGGNLTVNYTVTGGGGYSSYSESCGIYMLASTLRNSNNSLVVTGSRIAGYSSIYFDASNAGEYSSNKFYISNSELNGGAMDANSGTVTIKGAALSTMTGCFITKASSVGLGTSIYLDSATRNCLISGNVVGGSISDNGVNNYTQNNLIASDN